MRLQHAVAAGVLHLFVATVTLGDWIDYQDINRDISIIFGDSIAERHTSQNGLWSSSLSHPELWSFAGAKQESELTTSDFSFGSQVSASGGIFDDDRGGSSSLSMAMVLDTESIIDLDWIYQLDSRDAGFGGAGLRIVDMAGNSMVDISMESPGAMSGTSELQFLAGMYHVELYLDAGVESGTLGKVEAAFEVTMSYTSVPGPGTMAWLGCGCGCVLLLRRRQRA